MHQVKRPIGRYYGGKWNLAKWILSHFPPRDTYDHLIETHGGMASVSMRIDPMPRLVTYNDLDGNVVNFFRVLRDQPDDLIHKLKLTPWSRAEFEQACTDYATHPDPIERARLLAVVLWQSVGSHLGQKSGWRSQKRLESRYTPAPYDLVNIDHLYAAADRLKQMQIEHLPAEKLIAKYDHPRTLFYVDPPYMPQTRGGRRRYLCEMDMKAHETLAVVLNQVQGQVVLSGYATDEYKMWYEAQGWVRKDKVAQTNSGGKRVESIWVKGACTLKK